MTESEVEEEQLGEWVVMPPECEMSFIAWWKQLSNDSTVSVRYPHHHHGNNGKHSHAAKEAKSDFLTFIDINSQTNGRSADSTLATHFFQNFELCKHQRKVYETMKKECSSL